MSKEQEKAIEIGNRFNEEAIKTLKARYGEHLWQRYGEVHAQLIHSYTTAYKYLKNEKK